MVKTFTPVNNVILNITILKKSTIQISYHLAKCRSFKWIYFSPIILWSLKIFKILHGSWTASVACRRSLWMMQIDTWPWSHTCWGHMVLIGPQVCKWVKSYIFRLSYKLTLHDLWPSFVTFDLRNIWRFLHYINKPSLVPIGLQLFKWEFYILSQSYNLTSDDLWP